MKLAVWVLASSSVLLSAAARADEACPRATPTATPAFTGSVGAGFAKTSGNTDTLTLNATANAQWVSSPKNLLKASAFYLRGDSNGSIIVDQTLVTGRDEYHLSKRLFVFADVSHLRDRFKQLSYLLTVLGGAGFQVVKSDRTSLAVDVAAGGTVEEDLTPPGRTSGAYHVGQTFSRKLSTTATVTENLTGLWKTTSADDAYYHFDVSLAAAVVRRIELKASFVDDVKTRRAAPGVEKSDRAILTALVMKF
jgi:putative salt-induced outer membrane protein